MLKIIAICPGIGGRRISRGGGGDYKNFCN
jgi:hypothetical protein